MAKKRKAPGTLPNTQAHGEQRVACKGAVNKRKKPRDKRKNNTAAEPPLPPPAAPKLSAPASRSSKGTSLLDKMRQRLQGGRFRWLNERLYTSDSSEAVRMMDQEPELYEEYHVGFREQTKGWPVQPVDLAISWLKSKPSSWVVADLGCGDARLAASVPHRVRSFDLVATAPGVEACNLAGLPLGDGSVNAAFFCLSLMGTDYGQFIEEAHRVLADNGWLWIAEVQSRFQPDGGKSVLPEFLDAVQRLGFAVRRRDTSNSHFVLAEFQKRGAAPQAGAVRWPELKACQYKKR